MLDQALRSALRQPRNADGRHDSRRMRPFLEYLHDWIGEIGYYYDPRLLLRSPLLVG